MMLAIAHVNKLYTYVKKVGFNQLILGKKKTYANLLSQLRQHPCVEDISVSFINIAEFNLNNATALRKQSAYSLVNFDSTTVLIT